MFCADPKVTWQHVARCFMFKHEFDGSMCRQGRGDVDPEECTCPRSRSASEIMSVMEPRIGKTSCNSGSNPLLWNQLSNLFVFLFCQVLFCALKRCGSYWVDFYCSEEQLDSRTWEQGGSCMKTESRPGMQLLLWCLSGGLYFFLHISVRQAEPQSTFALSCCTFLIGWEKSKIIENTCHTAIPPCW